jgi:hypothetical protein
MERCSITAPSSTGRRWPFPIDCGNESVINRFGFEEVSDAIQRVLDADDLTLDTALVSSPKCHPIPSGGRRWTGSHCGLVPANYRRRIDRLSS